MSVHFDTSHIVRNHQSQPFSISFYRLLFVTHFNWNFPISSVCCLLVSIKIYTCVRGGEENKWKFLYARMMCLGNRNILCHGYSTWQNTRHGTYNELYTVHTVTTWAQPYLYWDCVMSAQNFGKRQSSYLSIAVSTCCGYTHAESERDFIHGGCIQVRPN